MREYLDYMPGIAELLSGIDRAMSTSVRLTDRASSGLSGSCLTVGDKESHTELVFFLSSTSLGGWLVGSSGLINKANSTEVGDCGGSFKLEVSLHSVPDWPEGWWVSAKKGQPAELQVSVLWSPLTLKKSLSLEFEIGFPFVFTDKGNFSNIDVLPLSRPE